MVLWLGYSDASGFASSLAGEDCFVYSFCAAAQLLVVLARGLVVVAVAWAFAFPAVVVTVTTMSMAIVPVLISFVWSWLGAVLRVASVVGWRDR